MVIDISAFLSGAIVELSGLPALWRDIITVLFFILVIFIYSILVWKFYRAVAHKDVIALNLQQYNSLEYPTLKKMWAAFLYFLEYLVIAPFLIFFWFAVFALVILIFSDGLSVHQTLLLSAAIVGSIRLCAYYSQDLAREVAKLLPLTILGIMILTPGFLSIERAVNSLGQVPEFILTVGYYLAVIITLEIVLRFFDLFRRLITDSK